MFDTEWPQHLINKCSVELLLQDLVDQRVGTLLSNATPCVAAKQQHKLQLQCSYRLVHRYLIAACTDSNTPTVR